MTISTDDLMKIVHGPTELVPGSYVGDIGELICHKDIDKLGDAGMTSEEIGEHGQMCVGMIRYTNSIMKVARVPEVEAFQDAVAKVKDVPVIPRFKLKEHHTLEAPKTKRAKQLKVGK